jgi:hypothetical protein
MRKFLIPLAALLTAAAAALLPTLASASTSSPGQAGYQVTGTSFVQVQGSLYLRAPGQYSAGLTGFGDSVSLWSGARVVQLGVSATTNPASPYSPAVAVFSASTHALVAATGNGTITTAWWCPAGGQCQPASQGGSFPAGDTVTLNLLYVGFFGNVEFTVADAAGNTFQGYYHVGGGRTFGKAEVTSDFGDTPWDEAAYTAAPSAQMKVALWSGVKLQTASGRFGSLKSARWSRSELVIGGSLPADASGLGNRGRNFTTYLEPAP